MSGTHDVAKAPEMYTGNNRKLFTDNSYEAVSSLTDKFGYTTLCYT